MSSLAGRIGTVALLAVAALAVPQAAAAQDSTGSRNHLYDKWQVGIAFTTVLNNSEARVDASNGDLGTALNFKDVLGISGTSIQPALGLRWKPGRKTEFDLGYQFLNQTGTRSFNDSIFVGGDTLSGTINADTKLGSSNATLQFKYSLWARPRHNIGLAIGLGAIFFNFQFDATADGCAGPNCASGSVALDKSVVGPTGSLGVFGIWRLGDRWYLGADARGLGAKVDRYDISVFEGNAQAQYYLSDSWGVSAAMFYTDVTVDIAAKTGGTPVGDLVGKVSYGYTSLRLGAVYAF